MVFVGAEGLWWILKATEDSPVVSDQASVASHMTAEGDPLGSRVRLGGRIGYYSHVQTCTSPQQKAESAAIVNRSDAAISILRTLP